jgi:NADPH2:quinone reductase
VKAAVNYASGEPSVFRYEDVPGPEVGPAMVRIRTEVVSIEGADVPHRAGGDLGAVPHIAGYQSAGAVDAVGDGVTSLSVGDRAVTVGLDGFHAELRVMVVDRSFSPAEAADAHAYIESRAPVGRAVLVP